MRPIYKRIPFVLAWFLLRRKLAGNGVNYLKLALFISYIFVQLFSDALHSICGSNRNCLHFHGLAHGAFNDKQFAVDVGRNTMSHQVGTKMPKETALTFRLHSTTKKKYIFVIYTAHALLAFTVIWPTKNKIAPNRTTISRKLHIRNERSGQKKFVSRGIRG